jgi:hypothetical protein
LTVLLESLQRFPYPRWPASWVPWLIGAFALGPILIAYLFIPKASEQLVGDAPQAVQTPIAHAEAEKAAPAGPTATTARPAAAPLAVFQAREIVAKDWDRTLVTYPVRFSAGQAFADNVRLIDSVERERPYQLSQVERHSDGSIAAARLSFFAALRKQERFVYRLLAEKPTLAVAPPTIADQAKGLTLDNGQVAVRLPRIGSQRLAVPLTFSSDHAAMLAQYGRQAEAGLIPGPIQGVRLVDGRWVGGSYFWSAQPQQSPRVIAYRSEIVEAGPLFVEGRVHYDFGNGGYYELTARVLTGDPAVRIDEQMDLKQMGPGATWQMVVSLAHGPNGGGWKPDRAFWSIPDKATPPRDEEFELALRQVVPGSSEQLPGIAGSSALDFTAPATKVCDVEVWYYGYPAAHYFGLLERRALNEAAVAAGRCPFLGVVPLHAGSWRGNQNGPWTTPLMAHAPDDVALHWPIMADLHPYSVLHTGEYDPDRPRTFRRRLWALMAGPPQFHHGLFAFRDREGNVNLDRYKDWVLDWPQDPAVTYPRLILTRADVQRLKQQLGQHPARDILRDCLFFRDEPARGQRYLDMVQSGNGNVSPRGQVLDYYRSGFPYPWTSHYHQSQETIWATYVDELLASTAPDPSERRKLRAQVAAACHLLAEPDFNPRGSMMHLGNPNMPINRFFGLTFGAALIPDHPRAKEWLDVSEKYVRYKLALNVAPGGAWNELITYMMASMHVVQAALVLDRAGRLTDETAALAARPARFALELLTPPDPRFGTRTVPNWGHEGSSTLAHWLVTAAVVRERDPELARALVWAWDQLGRPLADQHDLEFSRHAVAHTDLLAQLPKGYVPSYLKSVWLPGFGAVLRAHAGDPLETYLSYRQGYQVSHSDANQGDFVLYAKGAPLSTLSLSAYAVVQDWPTRRLYQEFGWHNYARFGSQKDTARWPAGPLSQVQAHSFGNSVDYLRGAAEYAAERWTRQIVFLKGRQAASPNYFVFRDSYDHAVPAQPRSVKWWYLRTPAAKGQVTSSGAELHYIAPTGPRLDVHFLDPAAIAVESRDVSQEALVHNQAGENWKRVHGTAGAPSPKLADHLQLTHTKIPEAMTVSAVGPLPPEQDVVVVLYPRMANEAAPQYERLGRGVAKITTSESTDYVFVDRRPMQFRGDGVEFEGVAGAVRVYPEEVHFIIAEGPGRVAYQGTVLSSPVPVTRVLRRDELKQPRVLEVPTPPTKLAFALDAADGAIAEVAPGVRRQDRPHGYALEFQSATLLTFARENVVFEGKRGGLVVDTQAKTTRLVLLEGEKIGVGDARAWGCNGPYEIVFHQDHVTGTAEGPGRCLYLRPPDGLKPMPVLVMNDQTYAPGIYQDTLLVPLLPGETRWELKTLEQPPLFGP